MTYFIIFAIVIVLVIAICAPSSTKNTTHGQIKEDNRSLKLESVSMQDSANNEIFETMKKIYVSGESYFNNSIIDKNDIKTLNDKIKAITNEHDADYIGAMQLTMMMSRDPMGNAPSSGITLQQGEVCWFKTKNCILNTIQKLYKTVTYVGYRNNVSGFRNGNYTLIGKDVEGFKAFGGGSFYITNKRLIFVGASNKTKVVPISSILAYAPYENTGIIFTIENSTPIIANFACNGMFNISKNESIPVFNDDRCQCLYALDAVINK